MQKEVDNISSGHLKIVHQLNTTITQLKDEQNELLDELESEKRLLK